MLESTYVHVSTCTKVQYLVLLQGHIYRLVTTEHAKTCKAFFFPNCEYLVKSLVQHKVCNILHVKQC